KDPNGNLTTSEYDDDGLLTKTTDALGRVREYTYYGNHQLATEVWKDNKGSTVNTRSWNYDGNNQMTNAGDTVSGGYVRGFDALGRLTQQVDPWGITLTYGYDAADRMTSASDSNGGVMTYTRDDDNRLTSREFALSGTKVLKLANTTFQGN